MGDQIKYANKLKDAKVLVIGGSSGIGYAAAEALVENGCHVTISSSNQSRIDAKVAALKESYPSAASRISGHVCDLGDEGTIEANIVALLDACGTLDHIIYTAGDKLARMELSSASFASMRQAGLVRFYGPLLVGKYAKKYLSAGPRSSLTLTTGSVSERPKPDWAVVNSYATGLHGMVRGLALDLKPIRVNLVSPGFVQTELWGTIGLSAEQQKATFDEASKELPTGHVGRPEEVAETYLYLLKDTNITGSMISTNGGVMLVGP